MFPYFNINCCCHSSWCTQSRLASQSSCDLHWHCMVYVGFKGKRSSIKNWEKFQTIIPSFWGHFHFLGQSQRVALPFWPYWCDFVCYQVLGSKPCHWGWEGCLWTCSGAHDSSAGAVPPAPLGLLCLHAQAPGIELWAQGTPSVEAPCIIPFVGWHLWCALSIGRFM